MLLAPYWFFGLGAIVLVWLVGLTVWVYKTASHYARLVGRTGGGDLRQVLETLLEKTGKSQKHIQEVDIALAQLAKNAQKHIQKVGLVKFNPYGDTGGNQSFALSLLDTEATGVIVLSLHGRDGTRMYIKNVTHGKSDMTLSKEEKRAIDEAR